MSERPQLRPRLNCALPALLLAAGLCVSGCGDDLDTPNRPAEIVAVGQIDPPLEACGGSSGSEAPAPSGEYYLPELARDMDSLAIPYLIIDREGDDQAIRVEICSWEEDAASDCGVAIMGPGGDGASSIPTAPANQCVLHVFNWEVGCGRFIRAAAADAPPKRQTAGVDEPLVAQISVVGAEQPPIISAPFTLSELGFDALPTCE